MANQQQIHAAPGGDTPNDDEQAAGQVQLNTTGTDSLLDEIDALLDSNTEQFVSSYVQKGGE
ncbi:MULTISPECIES: ubiquitin-like protein Pup [unclassified Corynebacterium]|uniref:ubiquitin-like protein Pup n=1 Tax=unclassified Corynebacterium TaxID=2624378 RepID=UPI002A90ACEE|nr:ubiquitin-like protein Pup [Corynebacterium sp.]MDY5785732.1 ubiquitin-like protein Pup [Corynebacterium sp.]